MLAFWKDSKRNSTQSSFSMYYVLDEVACLSDVTNPSNVIRGYQFLFSQ